MNKIDELLPDTKYSGIENVKDRLMFRIRDSRMRLFNLRMSLSPNHHKIRETRRSIARDLFLLNSNRG